MCFFNRKKKGVEREPGAPGRRLSAASTTQFLPKRRVYVNASPPSTELDQNGQPMTSFVPNKIRTAKYTLFTFLPKNLFEQFRRVANMYFLFLVILQTAPSLGGGVSPVLAATPLVSIISVTALKDAIEDWKRRQQDNSLNRSQTIRLGDWKNVNVSDVNTTRWRYLWNIWKTFVGWTSFGIGRANMNEHATERLSERQDERDRLSRPISGIVGKEPLLIQERARWRETRWQDIQVGDIVKLHDNEAVPADLIILSTSEPDGLSYVETKNLDGETNLKVRHCVQSTSFISNERDCERVSFFVESEPPHANLYSYMGVVRWVNPNNAQRFDAEYSGKSEPVSINNVVLRGCVMRNTEWIVGLVVYTGAETKIMLNSGDTPSKRSRIEIETNFHVTMNFIILFLLCLGSAIADAIYFEQPTSSADFFEPQEEGSLSNSGAASGFLTFWASLIIFQNIVPISLYISIEMVKTVQAYFIHADTDMYYDKLDLPCIAKTWNISDDLGQIEYIFSDKTGTLTQNVMEYRKCTINGVSYGLGETDATRGSKMDEKSDSASSESNEIDLEHETRVMREEMIKLYNNPYVSAKPTFIDSKLFVDLQAGDSQAQAIQDFFSALALCHTVLVERPDEGNPYKLDYKAQSPDEAALVGAARDVGFVLLDRVQDTLVIEVMGERKEFTLLNVLEFNSTRKRMSVIIRPPEGGVVLLCKGADSVIYERLENNRHTKLKEDTLADLAIFANEGLRTLCIAYRVIPDEEYLMWAKTYSEAASSVTDREDKIAEACEMIEHSLVLMGGTAIEDRLQEGVPECIATLSKAGIKIWVLTGDKTETAINIGFACNLLQKDMLLIVVTATDRRSTERQLSEALDKFFGEKSTGQSQKHALVIDGETLKYALHESLSGLLLDIGKRCNSVVCCRVSPLQKAKVVGLVKNSLRVMTLSIGDGANDVSMIQEANIGVGIAGEEGRQAVMAADYAFAQFRFLSKLLLVHGRWSYLRIAEMISCFFYKNIVWTIAMFWYQIWAGFSAQYLYDYTYIMLFNLVFTAFPVMVLGAFDQDVDAKTSQKYPQLYKRGIAQKDFTKSKFWLYVLDAVYQSAVCFFVPFGMLQHGQSHANGLQNNSLQDLGTMVAGSVVVTTNLYVGLNILNWTWIVYTIIGLSIFSFYLWVELYAIIASIGFFRVDQILFSEFDFWLTIAMATLVSLLPRYVVKYVHKSYWPIDVDIAREMLYLERKSKKGRKYTSDVTDEDRLPIAGGRKTSFDTSNASAVSLNPPDDTISEVSFNEALGVPEPVQKKSSLPKLPKFKLRNKRTDSVRSLDQLVHMGSGKRQSFTGYAFSGEESGFETFRQSVYRPEQTRNELHRSQTITAPLPKKSLLSAVSMSRSNTMPNALFRRRSGRDPSPSRSQYSTAEGSEGGRRRGDEEEKPVEEVELSVISSHSQPSASS